VPSFKKDGILDLEFTIIQNFSQNQKMQAKVDESFSEVL
jgi:hypothetical protein